MSSYHQRNKKTLFILCANNILQIKIFILRQLATFPMKEITAKKKKMNSPSERVLNATLCLPARDRSKEVSYPNGLHQGPSCACQIHILFIIIMSDNFSQFKE